MKTQVKTAHSTFAGDQLYICFTGETSMLGILTRNDFEYPKKKLDKDIYFTRWALLEMWSVVCLFFVFVFCFPSSGFKSFNGVTLILQFMLK